MARIPSLIVCACALLGWCGNSVPNMASPTTAPAEDSGGRTAFDHLPHREGGPCWTIDAIAAAVPPGALLVLEPAKPIPPVKDPAAAVRTALAALRSTDAARHELAFRLMGAADNQTHDLAATKLLALLQYHGIGTKADAGAAVRTALDAVRAGDREAAEYVAHESPKAIASIARSVSSIKKLANLPSPSVVKLSAPVVAMRDNGKLTLGAGGDTPLELELSTIVEKLKVGRVLTVAGVWSDGKLAALIGEVPEPSVEFKWDLIRRSIRRGEWHLQTVRVTVLNRGIQPIKGANLRVQCSLHGGLSRSRLVQCDALAPGQSQTISVSFDAYAFDYGETGAPEAAVTLADVDW